MSWMLRREILIWTPESSGVIDVEIVVDPRAGRLWGWGSGCLALVVTILLVFGHGC